MISPFLASEYSKNLSPDNIKRLEGELKLPPNEKLALLMKATDTSQQGLAKLCGIASGSIATIMRRGKSSASQGLYLDLLLVRTAHDRYLAERTRTRIMQVLSGHREELERLRQEKT